MRCDCDNEDIAQGKNFKPKMFQSLPANRYVENVYLSQSKIREDHRILRKLLEWKV